MFLTGEKIHISKKYFGVRGTLTQKCSFQESDDDIPVTPILALMLISLISLILSIK